LRLDDGSMLRTRLLVIAEGRESRLRAALGIEAVSARYEQTAVVCHVRTEQAHRQTAWQRFLPTGPLALLPLADGRSSIVWSSTEAEALLALDDAAFCRALGEASQHVLGAITGCTRRVQFPLALQHAERYVAGRAVLVGDAAHVVHPLAGQGVNLGFGDVAVLLDTIAVARAAGRRARFTFEELCDRPLGAADYRAIARHFDLVMVTDVPRIAARERNRAKRFITLVDVLYDAGRGMVLTADGEPAELYRATDGTEAFEFARTASRLAEMRTEAWLHRVSGSPHHQSRSA
jgi:hypothetical protein